MRKKIIEEGKYYGTRKKITESRVSHRFLYKSKYMRVDTKKDWGGLAYEPVTEVKNAVLRN